MKGIAVVNLGLKSIRCIVFDSEGNKRSTSSRPVHTRLKSNFVEQDAQEWITLCLEVMREATSSATSIEITHVTFTASASCLVVVDGEGIPIHPVIMVSDSRATEEVAQIKGAVHYDSSTDTTALRVTPDLMLPKILWIKRHLPRIYDRAAWFFSPADFLIYWFTGESIVDPNNATKFLAIHGANGFQYDVGLLADIGLDRSKLPAIRPTGTRIGTVKRQLSSQLGFQSPPEVILSTYDALCALIGSGVAASGVGAVISGTVTSVRTLMDRDALSLTKGGLRSQWVEEGSPLTIVGGSNNLGGGLIEWHKQAFYYDHEGDPYDLMDQEAATSAPGSEGLILLPYLLGERAPLWDAEVRGVYFGLDRRHTRPYFTRAVYESVAFSARHILSSFLNNGALLSEMRFSGGLSRSPVVSQIIADVLQVPLTRPAEFETTSLGACVITLQAIGVFRTIADSCRSIVKMQDEFIPDRRLSDMYTDMFNLYQQVYRDLKASHDVRARLMVKHESYLNSNIVSRENL